MSGSADQHPLLSNSSDNPNDAAEITEASPLIDLNSNEEAPILQIDSDIIEWDTSKLCQACRDNEIQLVLNFIDYSKQTTLCGQHAALMADRIDNETGLSPLHNAARYQQLDVCFLLLSHIEFKQGANIRDARKRTPLHSVFHSSNNSTTDNFQRNDTITNLALIDENIPRSKDLFEEYNNNLFLKEHPLVYLFSIVGGDVNACDKYSLTPMHYAVSSNNLAGVKQLKELKANIEAEDRQKIRPIHLACREGHLSIVEYLIAEGAKIDAVDADQWTPLHYACAKGHLDVIKLIKSTVKSDFRRSIQLKTNTGATCLQLAVQHGDTHSVDFILSEFHDTTLKILVNEKLASFGTPLHIAAKFCDPSMIALLHQYGADPFILNSHNQSPLHIASMSNRLANVQKLISLMNSSLLQIKDKKGQTALSVTTNIDIMDELMRSGADVTSLDNNHMNVLMVAVSKGQHAVVEHLLRALENKPTNIFEQKTKKEGRTLFQLAVQTGSLDMCSLLLTNSHIDWRTIDKQRMNAFHIAARHNYSQMIEFLCGKIKEFDKTQSSNTHSLSMSRASYALMNSVSQSSSTLPSYIDAQNDDGKTPLHLAVEQGHSSCVRVLLENNADALILNQLGQLPLHVAIQHGYSPCVELLLKAATVNMASFQSVLFQRQSPLITACENGFHDIVQLLLAQNIGIGLESNNTSQDNENALEIAIRYRHVETIHVLLEHAELEHWLSSIKDTQQYYHQTPLRDMIRYLPECAKHAFDKFIETKYETEKDGTTKEKTVYQFKFIDDYFLSDGNLYSPSGHQLYRNHPFIIALDSEHHFLLEHPLAQRLMEHKWKLYRPLFYMTRILTFLLLLFLTTYALVTPAPNLKSSTDVTSLRMKYFTIILRWIVLVLSAMNLFIAILEIILYRGLRVPFAQIFGIISFLTPILSFVPVIYGKITINVHWELTALSVFLQWFNIALVLRSVPFVGNCIIMFQSVLINFFSLTFVILPLLVAFIIAKQMLFFEHSAFGSTGASTRKISAMLLGEFDYETLFFSKPISMLAAAIFVPFVIIMAVVFMNVVLGLTIGDIKLCLEDARAKANAYRTRELIYIESTLPSVKWLKSNVTETDSLEDDSTEQHEPKNNHLGHNEYLLNNQRFIELRKLLDILNMLTTQAKQTLKKENDLERTLTQLLKASNIQSSTTSSMSHRS